jgi:hypothetical protein
LQQEQTSPAGNEEGGPVVEPLTKEERKALKREKKKAAKQEIKLLAEDSQKHEDSTTPRQHVDLEVLRPLQMKRLPKLAPVPGTSPRADSPNITALADTSVELDAAPLPPSSYATEHFRVAAPPCNDTASEEAEKEKQVEPSGWDSDDDSTLKAKKAVVCLTSQAENDKSKELEPSGWDSDDEGRKSRTGTEVCMPSPQSAASDNQALPPSAEDPVGGPDLPETALPSGWDSDEDASTRKAETRPKPSDDSDGKPKQAVALEFDMSTGLRKHPPKHLVDRLSKKKEPKASRKKGSDAVPLDVRAAALPPVKSLLPSADANKKRSAASKINPDSACGAPPKPAHTFVSARPKVAAEAVLPEGSRTSTASSDPLLDLLHEVTAEQSVPFKGSSSHGFVPNLHCTGCDFQVLRVEHHVWANNGDVSYMFLRNNYPNVLKLRAQLDTKKGCCAYCCQCSSRSADFDAELEDVAEGLKWKIIKM